MRLSRQGRRGVLKCGMKDFTFVDLFSGIGGIRIPFDGLGGRCVFSADYDSYCQITYRENFEEVSGSDINLISAESIPDHDILCAGFPCQPFSLPGVSARIGLDRAHGFGDKLQGNLFFDIVRILKAQRPKVFLLENVKNLVSHDRGNTFSVIKSELTALGYTISYQVVDAARFVPQHRERIFIVGFDNQRYGDFVFQFPELPSKRKIELRSIIEDEVDDKYTLSDALWKCLQDQRARHTAKGNGFGFNLVDLDKDLVTKALVARYYKDGKEILIKQFGKNPRRLTPRECANLMGFPKSFKIVVSDTRAYRQFGNSVVVPVIRWMAKKIVADMMAMPKK